MKLLTHRIKARFRALGQQHGVADPVVVAKFFNPTGAGRWYATEYDRKSGIFFGFVSIFNDHCDEWGYFAIDELMLYQGRLGLGIERDLYFTEGLASQVIPELNGKVPFGE